MYSPPPINIPTHLPLHVSLIILFARSDTNPLPSFYESRRRYWGNPCAEMSSDDSLKEPPTDAAYATDTAPVADDTAPVADDLAPDIDFLDEHIAVEHTTIGLTAVEHTVEQSLRSF